MRIKISNQPVVYAPNPSVDSLPDQLCASLAPGSVQVDDDYPHETLASVLAGPLPKLDAALGWAISSRPAKQETLPSAAQREEILEAIDDLLGRALRAVHRESASGCQLGMLLGQRLLLRTHLAYNQEVAASALLDRLWGAALPPAHERILRALTCEHRLTLESLASDF